MSEKIPCGDLAFEEAGLNDAKEAWRVVVSKRASLRLRSTWVQLTKWFTTELAAKQYALRIVTDGGEVISIRGFRCMEEDA